MHPYFPVAKSFVAKVLWGTFSAPEKRTSRRESASPSPQVALPEQIVSGGEGFAFPLGVWMGRPIQERPQQTKPKKGRFMNFSQGHSGTKVQCESCLFSGGHLKPVTLKPVIRIFRIFRVFASAFSALLLCGVSSNPCFCRVRGAFRIFRIFAVSGSDR